MTWPQDAYVGQKVVCVKTWVLPVGYGYGFEVGSVEKQIYTIRKIGVHRDYKATIVWLKEIINPCVLYTFNNGVFSAETGFGIFRFRPVQSTETGMSILKKLLIPTKEVENV